MPINFTPATLDAMARLAQVLDQHRFGAVMLVMVMLAGVMLVAAPVIMKRRRQ